MRKDKSTFAHYSAEFFGHKIIPEGISISKDLIQALWMLLDPQARIARRTSDAEKIRNKDCRGDLGSQSARGRQDTLRSGENFLIRGDFVIRKDHLPLVGLFKKPLLSIENENLRDLVAQLSE